MASLWEQLQSASKTITEQAQAIAGSIDVSTSTNAAEGSRKDEPRLI